MSKGLSGLFTSFLGVLICALVFATPSIAQPAPYGSKALHNAKDSNTTPSSRSSDRNPLEKIWSEKSSFFIKAYEHSLNKLGYSVGKPDSEYDLKTIRATVRIQKERFDSPPTGWATPGEIRQTICLAAVDEEDEYAQLTMGNMYLYGWGYRKNERKAIYLTNQAIKTLESNAKTNVKYVKALIEAHELREQIINEAHKKINPQPVNIKDCILIKN